MLVKFDTCGLLTDRASDETMCDLPGSVSSSLTLVTAIDEDVDGTADLHTPRSAHVLQDFNAGNTDPKSLLPPEPLELFPAARSGQLSTEQSPNQNLLVDLGNGNAVERTRTPRTELTQSESSDSSSGASAELTEIMESARQSNSLDQGPLWYAISYIRSYRQQSYNNSILRI
jgi:hypothetical protein